MKNAYDTLVDATNDMNKRGFNTTFTLKDDKMHCSKMDKLYAADEMVILEQHRFEGMSNPADNSIVVGLKCADGCKGTIISAYGTYGDANLLSFLEAVPTMTP